MQPRQRRAGFTRCTSWEYVLRYVRFCVPTCVCVCPRMCVHVCVCVCVCVCVSVHEGQSASNSHGALPSDKTRCMCVCACVCACMCADSSPGNKAVATVSPGHTSLPNLQLAPDRNEPMLVALCLAAPANLHLGLDVAGVEVTCARCNRDTLFGIRARQHRTDTTRVAS